MCIRDSVHGLPDLAQHLATRDAGNNQLVDKICDGPPRRVLIDPKSHEVELVASRRLQLVDAVYPHPRFAEPGVRRHLQGIHAAEVVPVVLCASPHTEGLSSLGGDELLEDHQLAEEPDGLRPVHLLLP